MNILVTGGAGFIGSHLTDELLKQGYDVRVFDCLAPQVHGEAGFRPEYLDDNVELIVGDIRDEHDEPAARGPGASNDVFRTLTQSFMRQPKSVWASRCTKSIAM